MLKRLITICLLIGFHTVAESQVKSLQDTSTVSYALSHGELHGSARYFLMVTDNRHGLTDGFAHAAGGGLKYQTAAWHGFRLGFGTFLHTEIGSSGLDSADKLTGSHNRYEIGLFDVENTADRHTIFRLEELYLNWHHKKWEARIGKQFINTPFLNLQDGRMRPSAVEGVWIRKQETGNIRWEAGWFWRMSPRSTRGWYSTGRSIGLYPTGVNEDGSKSLYPGQLSSRGNFLAAIHGKASRKLDWHASNLFTENIMNTALLEADWQKALKKKRSLRISAQVIRQDAVHNGGHPDPHKTYMAKGSQAWVFSGRAGYTSGNWEHSISYTRITRDGRYLMPREWGRDPFYTFMPRERNEGFGGVDAIVAMSSWKLPQKGLQSSLALGYHHHPPVTDTRLNKYGMPSYWQLNAELRYKFHGALQGFDVQLLMAAKEHIGTLPANLKYVIHKVDMVNWNLVVNYGF